MVSECNELIVAYLTNETLRNANEIHFIPCDIIVTSNSFNVIHSCNEFYTAVDCWCFNYDVK